VSASTATRHFVCSIELADAFSFGAGLGRLLNARGVKAGFGRGLADAKALPKFSIVNGGSGTTISEVNMDREQTVWVFCGDGSRTPAGVFSSVEVAETWIRRHGLSGMLSAYPLDEGAYEWAIRKGYFVPKREEQSTPVFVQKFSSASQDHFHYIAGVRD
jgi:hypothetical protein